MQMEKNNIYFHERIENQKLLNILINLLFCIIQIVSQKREFYNLVILRLKHHTLNSQAF